MKVREHGLASLAGELLVLVGGDRALLDYRVTMLVEVPEARAIRLPAALPGHRVGGFEQPEGGAHALRATAHAKQAAHVGPTVIDCERDVRARSPTAR